MSNIFGIVSKSGEHEDIPAKRQLITAKKLLLENESDNVIKKMIEVALTDGHPVQGAALKMCVDRMLPVSEFESEGKGGITTVIIDRSCGGKVIIKQGGGVIEMDTQEYLGSQDVIEHDENG